MKRLLSISMATVLAMLIGFSSVMADIDEAKIKKELPMLLGSNNQGTKFYMTFHPCWQETGENNELKIYVASAVATNVTLEIPAMQYVKKLTTTPNDVFEFGLSPTTGQMYTKDDRTEPQPQQVYKGRACIVTADDPVVCYGVTRYKYTSDGYLAVPLSGLGTEYIVSSWNDPGLDNGTQYLTSYTSIVAAYDKTKVEFTLGGERDNYTPGRDPLTVGDKAKNNMDEGDVWLIGVNGDYNDVSGSYVKATKPVAVISGSFCAYVPIQVSACDFVIEQDLPMHTWGTKYHATVIADRLNASFIRIYVSEPNTYIYRDGDQWAKVNNVGGEIGTGYISRRALLEGVAPRPVTISADNRFSVTQYNCGQSDDGVISDPFQMVLTPMEQYQKKIIFCTPGVRGGFPFKKNYLNLCYRSTEAGLIPNDMEIGIGHNGQMSWQKLNTKVTNPGVSFVDPDVTDGREWKAVTIPLDDPSAVYAIRGDTKFSAYGYGFADYDSYGWPVAIALADLSKPDIWPPTPNYDMDCYGNCIGNALEEPYNVDSLRSNFSTVQMIDGESFNYEFKMLNEDDFFPGETREVEWELTIEDSEADAFAVLLFTDRAGNETRTEIEYKRTKFSMSPRIVSWPLVAYNDAPSAKQITLTNDSDKPVTVDSLMLLSKDASRTWDENGFMLDNDLYETGQLPYTMQPGEQFTFNVTFDPNIIKDLILSGEKSNFVDSVGIKAYWSDDEQDYCYYKYQAVVKASTGTPLIDVGRIDFGQETVDNTTELEIRQIRNDGTSLLTITGVTQTANVDNGVFKVVNIRETSNPNGYVLGDEITPDNPLEIEADQYENIAVVFTPNARELFDAEIFFISDADSSDKTQYDPVLELTGEGIEPGIKVDGYDWGEQRAHIAAYDEPGNNYGNASFPYTVDDKLFIENTGNQRFTIVNVKVTENTEGDANYFLISDPKDASKTYSIEEGLQSLVLGKEMGFTDDDNRTRIFPVSYDPKPVSPNDDKFVGEHLITVTITGDMDGFEVNGSCTFRGEAFYPQAATVDYFFTEDAVQKAIDAGYPDTHYPPEGTAIVNDTEIPYYEMEIEFTASDWDYAHPVNVYGIDYDNNLIANDIDNPGDKVFAMDQNDIDAIINNPVAPGESVFVTARFFNTQTSPNGGMDNFVRTVTFVTDADETDYVSTWTAKAIDQNASTEGGEIVTCVKDESFTTISITNEGNDVLDVLDIVWQDDYTAGYNNGNERFEIAEQDKSFSLQKGETRIINVGFEQAHPDNNNFAGLDQVFEFKTNILESNSDVQLPITATVHTEVISYPRDTYVQIEGKAYKETSNDRYPITFEKGGTEFTYEIFMDNIDPADLKPGDEEMTHINETTDLTVRLIYDANFMAPVSNSEIVGDFGLLGSGLDAQDYEVSSASTQRLTQDVLDGLVDLTDGLYSRASDYITDSKNSENMDIVLTTIEIKNISGLPVKNRDIVEVLTVDFNVFLNENLLNAVSEDDANRQARILHDITTNEPCLELNHDYDAMVQLKPVCAENLRLVEINTDKKGIINFDLDEINPNPVSSNGTDISYTVAFDCMTTIEIYNAAGEVVATPVAAQQAPGTHAVAVPINDLSSGIYFVRMNAGPFTKTIRMTVAK